MHHLVHFLQQYGYGFITLAIALECAGLLVPGEAVLLGSSVYASTGHGFHIGFVVAAASLGAAVGFTISYWLGRLLGHRLLARHGWRVGLTANRLALGRYLFRKHGAKVVVFSRFASVLRSFGGLLAGANEMPWRDFMFWNLVGAVAWPVVHGFGAYFIGSAASHLALGYSIAIASVAVGLVIYALRFLRRNEVRLTEEALRCEAVQVQG